MNTVSVRSSQDLCSLKKVGKVLLSVTFLVNLASVPFSYVHSFINYIEITTFPLFFRTVPDAKSDPWK